MKISNKLIDFLDEYNGKYGDTYINSEFRVYYVLKNKSIENAFCISRENHTLAQANKIVKRLMEIMYDDSYSVEYTGQIQDTQINPIDYTDSNEYLEYSPSLYIM